MARHGLERFLFGERVRRDERGQDRYQKQQGEEDQADHRDRIAAETLPGGRRGRREFDRRGGFGFESAGDCAHAIAPAFRAIS